MNPARISPFSVPCVVWAHRLAALHPNDLAPHEQRALQDHLAQCSACASVFAAYQAMDASLLSLPAVQPSAQQAAHLAALIDDQTSSESRWKPVTNRQGHYAPPARQPDRMTQLARRVSLLAAALVVILLAGSAFVLFAPRHPPATGTRTSPTLYAVSATGTVSAIAASSGKTIWSTPLHIRPSEQFLVSDQKIFLGSSDYFLYALQTSNGRLLWQRSYKDLTTVGPQTVAIAPYPASDEKAIYFGTPKGIYAWRASDGQPIWQYSTPAACGTQWGICAPEVETVNTGVVYAYLDGLYALDATDGSLLWHDSNVYESSRILIPLANHLAEHGLISFFTLLRACKRGSPTVSNFCGTFLASCRCQNANRFHIGRENPRVAQRDASVSDVASQEACSMLLLGASQHAPMAPPSAQRSASHDVLTTDDCQAPSRYASRGP